METSEAGEETTGLPREAAVTSNHGSTGNHLERMTSIPVIK